MATRSATKSATRNDVTTYTVRQALAAKVADHIEIAVEAGTKPKLKASADPLDALVGDLETIVGPDGGASGAA